MSLRLEKSYGTWFREYRPIYTIPEAGSGRYVRLDHEFIGRAAYEARGGRRAGAAARRVRRGPRPGRPGRRHRRRADLARRRGRRLGHVGRLRPSRRAVASRSATCRRPWRRPDGPGGDGFEIEIIGRRRPARLQPEPLFDPAGPADARVTEGRIVVDGRPIAFEPGDSVAVAIVRAGEVPGRGGTLCLAGDCGNCLGGRRRRRLRPDVPGRRRGRGWSSSGIRRREPATPRGRGAARGRGRATRRRASSSSAEASSGRRRRRARAPWSSTPRTGSEVVGDLSRPDDHRPDAGRDAPRRGRRDRRRDRRGRDPAGLPAATTSRAPDRARRRTAAWRPASSCPTPVVTVGRDLVRFEGDDRARSRGRDPYVDGAEARAPARTVIVDLGRAPRDLLARMAGSGVPGHRRRRAPRPSTRCRRRPTDPAAVVCRCMGVTVGDLEEAWSKGFTELELLKRATLAGIGTCQGGACLPHVRSWIAARTGERARTVHRPARVAPDHARRGRRRRDRRRLPADAAPRRAPRARRADGPLRWLVAAVALRRRGRPSTGRSASASRSATSRTLGKLVVSGPDVVEALERIYPCHVADIKPGRSRYALLLNERGHVMDDGMILRESETRFVLTFTSGGAANAEMWLRDWIDTWGLRVHVMDRTMSLAAINVTGPLAGELLRRLGLAEPPRFLCHVHADVAGVPCHVMRLSFTGEAAWELHHPIDRSVELWRALMDAGADLGIGPHGLQALFGLPPREGPRHRRHGHRARHDAAPDRHGLGGPDGQAVVHRPGRARADREARRRPALGRLLDGRAGAGRGHADLRCRRPRGHRQRDRELALPAPRQGPDARLAAAPAVARTA